jgi:hypothetical protein
MPIPFSARIGRGEYAPSTQMHMEAVGIVHEVKYLDIYPHPLPVFLR